MHPSMLEVSYLANSWADHTYSTWHAVTEVTEALPSNLTDTDLLARFVPMLATLT